VIVGQDENHVSGLCSRNIIQAQVFGFAGMLILGLPPYPPQLEEKEQNEGGSFLHEEFKNYKIADSKNYIWLSVYD
jgi:hypothetical protein